jgi:predicted DNA-binding transcriptional regulator AlpA
MESNLDRLDRLFPEVLVLDPEQVGRALGWDRKKIYRIIEANAFPFPVLRVGNLISVPKIGLAKWLDDGIPSDQPKPAPADAAPAEPPKRKRGRPRKALSVLAFQNELRAEMERSILSSALSEAIAALNPRADDEQTRSLRDDLENALGSVRAIREYIELSRA